jgi:hypothetical protein
VPAAVIWIELRRRYACRYRISSPALRISEAHVANQSPPLMPAQPQNTEQPTCDRCRLRDDRAIYLDVVDRVLEIIAA